MVNKIYNTLCKVKQKYFTHKKDIQLANKASKFAFVFQCNNNSTFA